MKRSLYISVNIKLAYIVSIFLAILLFTPSTAYLDTYTEREVFLYDGSDVTQLTHLSLLSKYCQINDIGYVAWYSHLCGPTPISCDGTSLAQIFIYDGSVITKISSDAPSNLGMNDAGHLVWNDWLGLIFEYPDLD